MLRWKCWGRGDGNGGGDGGDGDCGARSHAACRGGPPWYAGEESSRAGRIFFACSALHRALGERQRFWFWADALDLSETAFCAPRNRPSPPNRFASRHLYQFQERSCCPPIPRRTLRCWVSGGYQKVVYTRRFHGKKNTGRTMRRRTNTNGSWLPMTGWRATGTPTGQLNQL